MSWKEREVELHMVAAVSVLRGVVRCSGMEIVWRLCVNGLWKVWWWVFFE